MASPTPSLVDHQLAVLRAFLRQSFPGAELIDRFDAEAAAHRFTLDPGRASKRTLLVPRPARGSGHRVPAHRAPGGGRQVGRGDGR
jgi:hypothetical protein